MCPMSSKNEQIRARCTTKTKQEWEKAAAEFQENYGPLARMLARFAMENSSDFRRFKHKEKRRRDG